MNFQLTKKNKIFSLLALLITIAALIAYQIYLSPIKPSSSNLSAVNLPSYTYGKTPPISIQGIQHSTDEYPRLKLRFRSDSNVGYPNVFQTAPFNEGMRMEISGSTLAVIIPDIDVLSGLRGFTVSTDFKTGQWYSLDIEVVNGLEIRIALDDKTVAFYRGSGIAIKTSELLVGRGFDESRIFHGQIEDIYVTEKESPSIGHKVQRASIIFLSILIAGLLTIVILNCNFLLSRYKFLGCSSSVKKISIFLPKSEFYCGLTVVLLAVLLYNMIFFNRFFPITEGWFSVYSSMIRNGQIPYRDFYLLLTPLYPIQLAFFQEIFGESFIALRILGIFIVLLISCFVYLILAKRFSPFVATVSTVTAIVYYQSGVAHITYDFTQVFSLYVIAATYLIISYGEISDSRVNIRNDGFITLLCSGVLVSLAFLIKQSNGALVVIFSVGAVFFATQGQKFTYRIKNIFIYCVSMALPLLLILAWLYFNGAFYPFIEQVVIGAISAKGSIWDILFSWIGRIFDFEFLNQLKNIAIYILPLLLLSFMVGYFRSIKNKKVVKNNHETGFGKIILYLIYFISAIGLAYFEGDFSSLWLMKPGIELNNYIVVGSFTLVVLIFLYSLIGIFSKAYLDKDLLICAVMSLGLIFGNGTSAAIGEISLYIGFALSLAFLMGLPNIRNVMSLLVVMISLSFVLSMASMKFHRPYYWWSVTQSDIRDSVSVPKISLLSGFRLPTETGKILKDVMDTVITNSKSDEDVFAFPNIPVFYLLTNRWPNSKVIVSWFDFLPDNLAREEAVRLKGNPPRVIINLRLPDSVWSSHETLFRNGRALGQRDIQSAITELTEEKGLYRLSYSAEIPSGCTLEVWSRINK